VSLYLVAIDDKIIRSIVMVMVMHPDEPRLSLVNRKEKAAEVLFGRPQLEVLDARADCVVSNLVAGPTFWGAVIGISAIWAEMFSWVRTNVAKRRVCRSGGHREDR
jgi:hypothetical protein